MRSRSTLLLAAPALFVLCLAGCGGQDRVLIDRQANPVEPPLVTQAREIAKRAETHYPEHFGWTLFLPTLDGETELDGPGADLTLMFGHDPSTFALYWVFADRDGRPVIEGDFLLCNPFHEGRAAVTPRILPDGRANSGYLIGYIDETGEFVIPPQYRTVGDFHEGQAWVEADDRFGYIDVDGEPVIPPRYTRASDFREGLACVIETTDEGLRWRYIDRTGETVLELPKTVARANVFSDGLAAVAVIDPARPDLAAKAGYIDKSGAFVIEPQFEDARALSDGLAPAKRKGRWGYIDKQGEFAIEPQYLDAFPFEGNVAFVHVRKRVWPWQSDSWRECMYWLDWMHTDRIDIL